jgi:hypothetical protein
VGLSTVFAVKKHKKPSVFSLEEENPGQKTSLEGFN